MPIQIVASPLNASSKLAAADVQAIITALAPLVTPPDGESLANAISLSVYVKADGTGSLNIQFKK